MSDFDAHIRSDSGSIRDRNEDCFLVDDERGLFAVADGMGGRMSGDVASGIFIETLEEESKQLFASASDADPIDNPEARDELLQLLTSVFLEANRQIYNTGQGEMGTTGEAVVILDGAALIGHVGDSRTYLIRDGEVNRATTDHTFADQLDEEELETEEPLDHVLTRAIGTEPHVRVDTIFVELQPNDEFLLCTDGVTKALEARTIRKAAKRLEPDELVEQLVERTRDFGSIDDATALGVRVPEGTSREFGGDSIETTDKLELLQKLGLFKGLEERTILRLLRHVFTEDFRPGDHLIERGSTESAMFVIVSGDASVVRDGNEVARVEAGEHVGEMALIDDGPRSADVVADGEVQALEITPEQFTQMVTWDPEIGNRILSNMLHECVERLRETTGQVLIDTRDTER